MEKNLQSFKIEYWVRYKCDYDVDNRYAVLTFPNFESAYEIYENIRVDIDSGIGDEIYVELSLVIQDCVFARMLSYDKK